MRFTHSDYIAAAVLAASVWIAALWWHRHVLYIHESGDRPNWAFKVTQTVSGLLPFAASTVLVLTLQAATVPGSMIVASQLTLAGTALVGAIWWQSNVYGVSANRKSVTMNRAADINATLAVIVASAAFAPFGLIVGPLTRFNAASFWVPTALFFTGTLVFLYVLRNGSRRYRQANDGVRQHLRDSYED